MPSNEPWKLANGLPRQTLALAFSDHVAGRGFAAAFTDKTTEAIYTTTDNGSNWTYVSSVHAPVADALAINPTNPQDLVLLSSTAPAPGAYALQRSADGGHTWQAQTTSVPSSATISAIGWSDSTFVANLQLDRQPIGDNALVAFPVSGASVHLDVNGKLNGRSVPHVQLVSGYSGKLYIWGVDEAQAPQSIGLVTADLGKTWATLSPTAGGVAIRPVAASADGAAALAISADQSQAALSNDGGRSWSLQPPPRSGGAHIDRQAFVTSTGQFVLHVSGGGPDGTYTRRNGAWAKVTDRDIIAISTEGHGHLVRLWSYDANGLVTWLNY